MGSNNVDDLSAIENYKKLKENEMRLDEHIKNTDNALNDLKLEKKTLLDETERKKVQTSNNERELLIMEEKIRQLKDKKKNHLDVIMGTSGDVQAISRKLEMCRIVAKNQSEELQSKTERAEKFKLEQLESSAGFIKEDVDDIIKLEEEMKQLEDEKCIMETKKLNKSYVQVKQEIEELEKINQTLLSRLQRKVTESQKRKNQLTDYLRDLRRECRQ